MKKIVSILLLAALVLTAVSAMSIGAFADESSIKPDTSWYTDEAYSANGNKYLLDDAADVLGFSNLLAGIDVDKPQNFEGKTVELTSNVDLLMNEWGLLVGALHDDATRPESRDPLEFPVLQNYGFWGTFDGNGHSICGIKFDGYVDDDVDAHDCTLFGIVPGGKTATVKNLTIDFSTVEVSYFSGMIFSTIEGSATIESVYIGKDAQLIGSGQSIGTLAGRVMAGGDLTIKNCVIDGTHVDTWQKNRLRGGFVSTSYGNLTIENSAFYGEMTKSTTGNRIGAQHAGIVQVVGRDVRYKQKDANYEPSLTLKNVIICATIATANDAAGKTLNKVVYLMHEPAKGVTVNVENVFYVQTTLKLMGYDGEKIDRAAIMGSGASKFLEEKGLSDWNTTDKFVMPVSLMEMVYPDIVVTTNATETTAPVEKETTAPAGTENVEATESAEATEPEGTPDPKTEGCGSSVAGVAGMILVSALATACVVKKKED